VPNDIPDWTGQHLVQVISANGQILGDPNLPSLATDQGTEGVNLPFTLGGGVMASFKPLTAYARVGVAGPFKVGTATSVSPLFGQATTAGNLLVAGVTSSASGQEPTTAAAGWVKIVSVQLGSGWCAIWAKPNCGAAEAAPTFTQGTGGLSVMLAGLAEFSGGVIAAPSEHTGNGTVTSSQLTVQLDGVDAAFGDLVILVTRWSLSVSGVGVAFTDSFNNKATAAPLSSGNADFNGAGRATAITSAIIPAAAVSAPFVVQVSNASGAVQVNPPGSFPPSWPGHYDGQAFLGPAAAVKATVTLAANATKKWLAAEFYGVYYSITSAAASQLFLSLIDGVSGGAAVLWSEPMQITAVAGTNAPPCRVQDGRLGNNAINTALTVEFNAAPIANAAQKVALGAYLQ
jgi:hypothetical protein